VASLGIQGVGEIATDAVQVAAHDSHPATSGKLLRVSGSGTLDEKTALVDDIEVGVSGPGNVRVSSDLAIYNEVGRAYSRHLDLFCPSVT
jgi:hypothetical protein